MEFGCPLCNGIIGVSEPCPECGGVMEDAGVVENYYGPYSPYDNMELYPHGDLEVTDEMTCIHLFACTECGYDTRVAFPEVVL